MIEQDYQHACAERDELKRQNMQLRTDLKESQHREAILAQEYKTLQADLRACAEAIEGGDVDLFRAISHGN